MTRLLLILLLCGVCFSAAIGPLDDYRGHFKAYFYPYHGATLGYRLLYPYDYDSSNKYPLIVQMPGSSGVSADLDNTQQVTSGGFQNKWLDADNNYTAFAQTYPAFVLAPEPTTQSPYPDNSSSYLWLNAGSSYHRYRTQGLSPVAHTGYIGADRWKLKKFQGSESYVGCWFEEMNSIATFYNENPNSWFQAAVRALIYDLLDDDITGHTTSDFLQEAALPDTINIDADRIYYIGYSYGCVTMASFLIADRDLFAAAIGIDCYQSFITGKTYVADPSSLWGSEANRSAMAVKLAQRYAHIPILLLTGTTSPFYIDAQNHHSDLILGGHNAYLVSKTGIDHDGAIALFGSTQRFDLADYTEQEIQTIAEDGTHKTPIEWLFGRTKPATTDADPYPFDEYGSVLTSLTNYRDNETAAIYIPFHHKQRKTANSSTEKFEIVDSSTTTYYICGDKTIKIATDEDNALTWDKDGNDEHAFTAIGQRYRQITDKYGFIEIELVQQSPNNRIIITKNVKSLY